MGGFVARFAQTPRPMLAGLALTAAAILTGCPGTLENPERFSTVADAGACDIPGVLIPQRCAISGCHTTMTMAGDLDLQAPDVAARLVDVPATGCDGLLVDPENLEESVMYLVILQEGTTCLPMPQVGAALTTDEAQCYLDWLGTL
jgi:hypothetical protein